MRFGSAAFRNAKEMGPRKHACWTPDFVDVLVSFLLLTGGRGMASVDVRFDLCATPFAMCVPVALPPSQAGRSEAVEPKPWFVLLMREADQAAIDRQ